MNRGDVRFQCTGCHTFIVFSYGQTIGEIKEWLMGHRVDSKQCAYATLRVANDQT